MITSNDRKHNGFLPGDLLLGPGWASLASDGTRRIHIYLGVEYEKKFSTTRVYHITLCEARREEHVDMSWATFVTRIEDCV